MKIGKGIKGIRKLLNDDTQQVWHLTGMTEYINHTQAVTFAKLVANWYPGYTCIGVGGNVVCIIPTEEYEESTR